MLKRIFKAALQTATTILGKTKEDVEIIRNVRLLKRSDFVKRSEFLQTLFKFIETGDETSLHRVSESMVVPRRIKVIQVLARSKDNVIGINNFDGSSGKLAWKSPEDMKHFVSMTKGKICLVGGTTFRGFEQPLKNRIVLVLTRDKATIEKVHNLVDHYAVTSIEEALEVSVALLKNHSNLPNELMVIGGVKIYKETLDITDEVHISNINVSVNEPGAVYMDWNPRSKLTTKIIQYDFEGTV